MWKQIDGYYWPYRINEDGRVEKLYPIGEWREVKACIKRSKGKKYGSLVVHMRTMDGRDVHVQVKRLMIDAFLGGRKPGKVYGLRNNTFADCSLANIYETTQSDIGKRNGGPNRRCVEKIDREGNVIDLYSSITEAAKKNFICRKSVQARCAGRIKGDPFALDGFSYRYEEV